MVPYATGVKGRYAKIYFTLSTWNPYQIVQMSAIIPSEEEENDPKPYANNVNDRNDRKYAHVSVVMAHLAKVKNLTLKNSIQNSAYIADHIEWAQFHSYLELRLELKEKFHQLITNFESDLDQADTFAVINAVFVKLAYDYDSFKNIPKYEIYRKWALNAVRNGQNELLIDEINQILDHENFLSDEDYLCYAHGSEDGNEFKYARLSFLIANLAEDVGMRWNFASQGLADYNAHLVWARFRSVEEMRQEIIIKFNQIVQKFPSKESIATAYKEICKAVVDLNPSAGISSNSYEWALSLLKDNRGEILTGKFSELINDEKLLESI